MRPAECSARSAAPWECPMCAAWVIWASLVSLASALTCETMSLLFGVYSTIW